jgi:hypothetical protein
MSPDSALSAVAVYTTGMFADAPPAKVIGDGSVTTNAADVEVTALIVMVAKLPEPALDTVMLSVTELPIGTVPKSRSAGEKEGMPRAKASKSSFSSSQLMKIMSGMSSNSAFFMGSLPFCYYVNTLRKLIIFFHNDLIRRHHL